MSKRKQKISHVGEQYESTKTGPFKIIEDYGIEIGSTTRYVKIKFIYTGTEQVVIYNAAKRGLVRDPQYFMYCVKDKIFKSNNCGDFKIIEDLGESNNNKFVRILFIDTNTIIDTYYSLVKRGQVKDPSRFMYDNKDKIFKSNNCGDFKIIEDLGIINSSRRIKAEFLLTGSIVEVDFSNARRGMIIDPAYKNIREARESLGATPVNNIRHMANNTWRHLMYKCYNKNNDSYKMYGGKGVSVSDEWHDFEIFFHDIQLLPGWSDKILDPLNFNLDKDLIQYYLPHNERIYSKNTCIWLNAKINSSLANDPNILINTYLNDQIYSVNNLYYVVPTIQDCLNYGPFNNLCSATNMLNYCYASCGINKIYEVDFMSLKDVMMHTNDRKPIILKV